MRTPGDSVQTIVHLTTDDSTVQETLGVQGEHHRCPVVEMNWIIVAQHMSLSLTQLSKLSDAGKCKYLVLIGQC